MRCTVPCRAVLCSAVLGRVHCFGEGAGAPVLPITASLPACQSCQQQQGSTHAPLAPCHSRATLACHLQTARLSTELCNSQAHISRQLEQLCISCVFARLQALRLTNIASGLRQDLQDYKEEQQGGRPGQGSSDSDDDGGGRSWLGSWGSRGGQRRRAGGAGEGLVVPLEYVERVCESLSDVADAHKEQGELAALARCVVPAGVWCLQVPLAAEVAPCV